MHSDSSRMRNKSISMVEHDIGRTKESFWETFCHLIDAGKKEGKQVWRKCILATRVGHTDRFEFKLQNVNNNSLNFEFNEVKIFRHIDNFE